MHFHAESKYGDENLEFEKYWEKIALDTLMESVSIH